MQDIFAPPPILAVQEPRPWGVDTDDTAIYYHHHNNILI